jgi:4'-phosphopantetheinyl transferase
MSREFFSSSEREQLDAVRPALRHKFFLKLWTLKESYVKAHGRGLTLPLKQVSFDLRNPDRVELKADGLGNRGTDKWDFRSMELPSGHLLALAVSSEGPRTQNFATFFKDHADPGARV